MRHPSPWSALALSALGAGAARRRCASHRRPSLPWRTRASPPGDGRAPPGRRGPPPPEGQEGGLSEGDAVDQPHALRVDSQEALGDPEGQPGLPAAGGSREGHEPGPGHVVPFRFQGVHEAVQEGEVELPETLPLGQDAVLVELGEEVSSAEADRRLEVRRRGRPGGGLLELLHVDVAGVVRPPHEARPLGREDAVGPREHPPQLEEDLAEVRAGLGVARFGPEQ